MSNNINIDVFSECNELMIDPIIHKIASRYSFKDHKTEYRFKISLHKDINLRRIHERDLDSIDRIISEIGNEASRCLRFKIHLHLLEQRLRLLK